MHSHIISVSWMSKAMQRFAGHDTWGRYTATQIQSWAPGLLLDIPLIMSRAYCNLIKPISQVLSAYSRGSFTWSNNNHKKSIAVLALSGFYDSTLFDRENDCIQKQLISIWFDCLTYWLIREEHGGCDGKCVTWKCVWLACGLHAEPVQCPLGWKIKIGWSSLQLVRTKQR